MLVTLADSRLKLHDGGRGGIEQPQVFTWAGAHVERPGPGCSRRRSTRSNRFDRTVMKVLGPLAAGSWLSGPTASARDSEVRRPHFGRDRPPGPAWAVSESEPEPHGRVSAALALSAAIQASRLEKDLGNAPQT